MSGYQKKRVLVPTDFSDSFVNSYQVAKTIVEEGGELHVMYVVPPLELASPAVLIGTVDETHRAASAQKHLSEFLERHRVAGVTSTVTVGDAGNKITEYAKSNDIDLIVIPSHGNHGWKRLLLGSVAERVIRYAECPVLILRRED